MVASACKLSGGFSVVEVEKLQQFLKVLRWLLPVDIGLVPAVLETDASVVVELIHSKDVVLFELAASLVDMYSVCPALPGGFNNPVKLQRMQFRSRDVRKIYGSPVVVLDEDLQDVNFHL
ncbi:hypothetical protein LWI28_010280 [Acer negundo]|uniref:Uncharacterized protein n=1 Tax=Acer negundo TaxID=4023 RepID=A0AAD5NH08_ACENE|nr:hypothetical protein LWI28_010280 [Acer negundo]